jgi:c-di-GMP-binding flagellar brake protein YcgR
MDLPKPDFADKRFNIFEIDAGGVTRLFPDVGSLSEQAGIDFVYFLIDVMIKAQQFATSIATVGGKIHVALLTRNAPLRWISEEGFTFEHKHIPKFIHA